MLCYCRFRQLRPTSHWRAKPAVYFGGKTRITDFALSNAINSGIRRIGVLTQYKAHSLLKHIQQGWGMFRGEFGEFVELLPAQQRIETSWYAGTADAIFQNIDIIRNHSPEYVLILAGDHVYKMDYGAMLAWHVAQGADITVGCLEVPLKEASAFGVMGVNPENRIISFQEKPDKPAPIPGRDDRAGLSACARVRRSGSGRARRARPRAPHARPGRRVLALDAMTAVRRARRL